MRLFKSVATLGFYTILSRVMGFIRDVLIASVLGAGPVADAFYVAFKFPNFFRRLFGEGAFNAAFVPTFSHFLTKEGEEKARHAASDILSVLFLTLLGLVIVVELTIPWLMHVIAPGFKSTPYRFELAIEFTRITFPYILFASLAALYTGILNTNYRFAVGAASPILLNVTMILAMLFFEQTFATPGHALCWAVTIAGVGQFLWLDTSCRLNNYKLKLHRPIMTPPVKRVVKLMVPGALAAGVLQLNLLIGIIFLSYLPEGAVSYFFYADRLNQLPLSLVGVAISTALLPTLARQFTEHKNKTAHTTQNRAMEVSLFLILPASVALLVLSEPIIRVLFERYEFTAQDTIPTARILSSFALGLPAYVLVKIFSTSFFARHDTKTPLIAASFAVAANIILNLLLVKPLQHVGIALATSLASWVNVAWLSYRLSKERNFVADKRLKALVPRFITASLLMGIVVEAAAEILRHSLMGSELQRALALGIVISTGLAVYLSSCVLFKAVDIEELKANLFKKRATSEK